MSLTLEFASCVVKNLVNVPKDVMDGWVSNPMDLQRVLTEALCPPKKESVRIVLLRKITTVAVAGAKKFIADKATLKQANIGWTGDNFKKYFVSKVEEDVPDDILAVHNLEKASVDSPIRTELGDKEKTKLAYVVELIKKQSKGEDGVLLTNGYANIFYICGTDGNFWAVNADWRSGRRCWGVGADSVEYPHEWDAGSRIFSRDF